MEEETNSMLYDIFHEIDLKCSKSYKTQSYFYKHTATCGNQVQSD